MKKSIFVFLVFNKFTDIVHFVIEMFAYFFFHCKTEYNLTAISFVFK